MQICKLTKSTSSILLSLTINTYILKVYFRYNSHPERNTNPFQKQLQSILEVYFITKFLMDSSILETCKFKLVFSVTKFGNQSISNSILEVYFIFRVQKYI